MLNRYLQYLYEQKNNKYTIYCDMDGVLVDFVKGADKVCPGCDLDNSKELWPRITKQGPAFWANLEWTHDGKELWNHIKRYEPIILSATIPSQINGEGKKEWLRKHLGDHVATNAQIVLRSQKKNYANSNSILIDDMTKNIDEFEKHGGIGILHKNSKDTIKDLEKILGG